MDVTSIVRLLPRWRGYYSCRDCGGGGGAQQAVKGLTTAIIVWAWQLLLSIAPGWYSSGLRIEAW
jgi:hypothetical protein